MTRLLKRLTGFRFFERNSRGWELRFRWAEITSGFGLGLGLINWSEDGDWSLHVHLPWPNIYLKLPFLPTREPREQMLDKWGFSLVDTAVHLGWGDRTKIVHLPWAWEWHRTSHLLEDGRWVDDVRTDKHPSGFSRYQHFREIRDRDGWKEVHSYRYVLRSGEVQERTATIAVDEREWRRRWLIWCPWFARVEKSIDVEFSDEVGERTGSWKGGTIGCSYTIRPGETPLACLRRMESERTFR